MIAPPVKLSTAFDEPDQIIALIDQGAPYKTITAVQKNPPNDESPGWFRNFWALGGKVIFDGAEDAFCNPNFIAAAKESFKAEVIRPLTMMTNLNVPAEGSPVHLDLPFFRGTHQRQVPSWILAPMGYSGLFQEWAIPVASAITWFYEGPGGDFEYWPRGLSKDSMKVSPPYSNTSVVADNEYMYHRVGEMGPEDSYLADGISSEALLHRKSSGWEIRLGDELLRSYEYDEIRLSILWKAFCFKDQAAEDAFLDPAFDLTPSLVADIFCADLKKRNLPYAEPHDLAADEKWVRMILDTYNSPDGSAY